MQDQEWGKEHAPNIDVNSVGRLTLVKSASALQYGGDAMGGIIIAEGVKTPVKDSLYGKTIVTAASNGRGGGVTSQLTKSFKNGWYSTVQGTLKRFGDVESADYILSNTGLMEKDLSFRLGLNRFDYGLEGYYSYYNTTIGILRSAHAANASSQIRAILALRARGRGGRPPRGERGALRPGRDQARSPRSPRSASGPAARVARC